MHLLFTLADVGLGSWAAFGRGPWGYCWRIPLLWFAASAVCTTVLQSLRARRSAVPRVLWIGNIIGVALACAATAPRWHILAVWGAVVTVQALYGAKEEAQIPPFLALATLFASGKPGVDRKVKRSWYFKAQPLLGVYVVANFAGVAYQGWGLWCLVIPPVLLFLFLKAHLLWLLSLVAMPLLLFFAGPWEAFSWLGLYVPVGLYLLAWAPMEIELQRRLDGGMSPEQVAEAQVAEILGKPTRDKPNGEG